MKHFYTVLLLLVASVVSGFASTKIYRLDIDHADRVKVQINYEEKTNLVDGVNTFVIEDMPEYGVPVYVMPASNDFGVESVTNAVGTKVDVYNNNATFYFNSEEASHYYKIVTKDLAAARTAILTVSCDEPQKLAVRFGGSYRQVTLTEANQQVRFDPTLETTVGLEKQQYSDVIYGVTLNEQVVNPDQYGYYSSISIKNGDKLDVTMKAPDVDYTYTIKEMTGAESFISEVKVDGVTVADPHSFVAHAGSKVELTGKTNEYIFDKMLIGSQTVTYFSNPYTFTALSNEVIEVYAHKPATFTVSFDIDDPENVIIYPGYNESDAFALKAGKQDLTFTEDFGGNTIYINIKSSSKGFLTSVLKNSTEIYNGSSINTSVAAGDAFVIRTEKIVRDWKGVVYVKDFNDSYFFNFQSVASRNTICNLAEGYTQFEFGKFDVPMGLGFQPKSGSGSVVCLNGEAVSPMYENSFTFELSPADGCVIKVFVNGEPAKYALSFVMPESTEGISVNRDYITNISDFATPSVAHAGTVYHVTVPDTNLYTATLGDTALTFGDNNTAEFTPTADTTLTIAKTVDGIEDVTVGNNASTEVYNLQGIRVAGDASNLPAGLYIIGGKKVLVK